MYLVSKIKIHFWKEFLFYIRNCSTSSTGMEYEVIYKKKETFSKRKKIETYRKQAVGVLLNQCFGNVFRLFIFFET